MSTPQDIADFEYNLNRLDIFRAATKGKKNGRRNFCHDPMYRSAYLKAILDLRLKVRGPRPPRDVPFDFDALTKPKPPVKVYTETEVETIVEEKLTESQMRLLCFRRR